MARIIRIIKGQWSFFVALVWLIGWILTHLWPASWWLSVRAIHAFDAPVDARIMMQVDREIVRPFFADWSVLVRKWNGTGWEVYCTAEGGGDYRPDSALPDPLTLEWWTNGDCPTLTEGNYVIATIWTIRGGMLPDKIVASNSNVFEVFEPTRK